MREAGPRFEYLAAPPGQTVDLTNGEFIHDTAKQLRDVWLASLVVLLPASHESDEIGILDIDRRCDVAERQNFVHLEARSNVVDW